MKHYDYYNDLKKIRDAQLLELSDVLDRCKNRMYDFLNGKGDRPDVPYVVGYAEFSDSPIDLRVCRVIKDENDMLTFDVDYPSCKNDNGSFPCDVISEKDIPFCQFDTILDCMDEKFMISVHANTNVVDDPECDGEKEL